MKYSGNSDSLTTKRIGMIPCKIVLKCPTRYTSGIQEEEDGEAYVFWYKLNTPLA